MDSLYSKTSPCWSVYKGCVITPFVFPWCTCPFCLRVCPNVCCAFTFLFCHFCVCIYSVSMEKESSNEECFDAGWALIFVCFSPSTFMCRFSPPHSCNRSSVKPFKVEDWLYFTSCQQISCAEPNQRWVDVLSRTLCVSWPKTWSKNYVLSSPSSSYLAKISENSAVSSIKVSLL